MKQTEYLELNLMEMADQLSPKPLNENAEKLEAALVEHKAAISGRVMMACGSYEGSGTKSVAILTPGFAPQIVLMRQKGTLGISPEGVAYTDSFSVDGGWACWMGEDTLETSVYVPDTVSRTEKISFTAKMGSLSWTPESAALSGVDRNINNAEGVVYEWIAFGYGEIG